MRAEITPVEDPLAELNPQQRAAVLHVGSPLLVVAGPGSGKTRVLAHRIAYRIRCAGLEPQSVMAITFTNRAARELRGRVDELLLSPSPVRTGTFHWMCNGLLRRYADRIGYRRSFTVLRPSESRDILRQTMGTADAGLPLRSVVSAISAYKNGSNLASEAERFALPMDRLRAISSVHADALRKLGAMDLDDLLWQGARLLREDEHVRRLCRTSLAELLVDEYQDTNPVQHELLHLLEPIEGDLVVVGDEDQSIYGWRQASTGSSAQFLREFPCARVLTLNDTYRSTKHILRAASTMISHNRDRSPKLLRTKNPAGDKPICYVAQDEKDEASWIAREICRLVESPVLRFDSFAVLYRINAQSRAIEDALMSASVPYRVLSGQRFYDRPEIQTVTSLLRLTLDAGDDVAASFLLQQIAGVGAARLERLKQLASAEGRPLAQAFVSPELTTSMPTRVRDDIAQTGNHINRLRELRHTSLVEVVDSAIEMTACSLQGGDDPDSRESERDDLEELRSVVRNLGRGRMTLRQLVDRLSLDSEGDRERGDAVSLLSLHAAKGLEFPVVFLAGLEDGLLPHRRSLETDREIEEERRLCYVGLTRAKSLLNLSYAHTRALAGQDFAAAPSRFLREMGPANTRLKVSTQLHVRPRLHAVAAGERVRHARWGDGTVTASEGVGRETLVTIAFDGGNSHRMQLCHAPLARLAKESPHRHAGR